MRTRRYLERPPNVSLRWPYPTKAAAMAAFDADAEVTALKKVDPAAAARIREFVENNLADYLD